MTSGDRGYEFQTLDGWLSSHNKQLVEFERAKWRCDSCFSSTTGTRIYKPTVEGRYDGEKDPFGEDDTDS